jgi:hypothetical protein
MDNIMIARQGILCVMTILFSVNMFFCNGDADQQTPIIPEIFGTGDNPFLKMRTLEIRIHAIHQELAEKEYRIMMDYNYPANFGLERNEIHLVWNNNEFSFSGKYGTMIYDYNTTISGRFSQGHRILEKFEYSGFSRNGSSLFPHCYDQAYLNITNLSFHHIDSVIDYDNILHSYPVYRTSGITCGQSITIQHYLDTTWRDSSSNIKNKKWEYKSTQWNDSSYIQVRFIDNKSR